MYFQEFGLNPPAGHNSIRDSIKYHSIYSKVSNFAQKMALFYEMNLSFFLGILSKFRCQIYRHMIMRCVSNFQRSL